jgi:hypothetical protein
MNFSKKIQTFTAKGWAVIAIGSLFLASILAILLIAMRIPFTPLSDASLTTFHGVLVLHVTLSFLIWLTAAMCHVAQRQLGRHPSFLPLLALLGITLILASYFSADFQPLPVNYFPISNSALFFAGMLIYLSAVAMTALRILLKPAKDLSGQLIRITMMLLLLAILTPLFLLGQLPVDLSDQSRYELLFWASGHIYVCALGCFVATLWLRLSNDEIGPRQSRIVLIAAALPAIAALAALGYTLTTNLLYRPKHYHDLFQYLMMFTSCLPVMAVLLLDLKQFVYSRLSILAAGILLLGGLQGWFMTYGTLTVPAHYHAMLGTGATRT